MKLALAPDHQRCGLNPSLSRNLLSVGPSQGGFIPALLHPSASFEPPYGQLSLRHFPSRGAPLAELPHLSLMDLRIAALISSLISTSEGSARPPANVLPAVGTFVLALRAAEGGKL